MRKTGVGSMNFGHDMVSEEVSSHLVLADSEVEYCNKVGCAGITIVTQNYAWNEAFFKLIMNITTSLEYS